MNNLVQIAVGTVGGTPHRRAADLKLAVREYRRKKRDNAPSHLVLCLKLIPSGAEPSLPPRLSAFFSGLAGASRYYWISALYTLLMPQRRRQQLAAYFTPPHLCQYLIRTALEHGFDLEKHTALDPACGGAAFLAPLAVEIRNVSLAKSLGPDWTIDAIEQRLAGIELEPGLASLSQALVSDVVSHELVATGRTLRPFVKRGNGLAPDIRQFDAVLSNPPYGRVFRPSKRLRDRWASVISDGHVNHYALFVAATLERTRAGGIAALIIPTSFTAGPYFAKLREHLTTHAEVIRLDMIEKRSELFMDVTQDTCVLLLRKRAEGGTKINARVASALLKADGTARQVGTFGLSAVPDQGVWVLPRAGAEPDAALHLQTFFDPRLSNLGEYGCDVKVGYFVWNRSKDRLRNSPDALSGEVPLIWAHDVRSDSEIRPSAGPRSGRPAANARSWVTIAPESTALFRRPAVVLQRTTNTNQPKRLIAGWVDQSLLERHGSFVTENHTIVVAPRSETASISIRVLSALLNSRVVDARYRRISGTVSISAKVLGKLPLPQLADVLAAVREFGLTEAAFDRAYELSLRRPLPTTIR